MEGSWKGKEASSLADLAVCLSYRRAEEAAAAQSEPGFPGAKNAEVEEEKSHHATPGHLRGAGGMGGTGLGNAVPLHSSKAEICKALQRAHLWAHRAEGPNTDGMYLLQALLGRGCLYGLEMFLIQCLLLFRIIRFPWQLVKAKVRRTIEEALKVWSDVTPLTFTEVQEGRADIVIDFTR